MEWLIKFPQLDDHYLNPLKRSVDGEFRSFTRAFGDEIESFFTPLLHILIFFENLMTNTPWPLILGGVGVIAWFATRSWKVVTGCILALLAIGFLGMWEDTMKTISLILVCTFFAIAMGIPIGIAMSRSRRVEAMVQPILDVMQTMPAFVYLIPVVMLLGIGRVPGFIAVVIYAVPPIIRLTNLGIRLVDKDVLEAADAYGCSNWQKLVKVQMPLALPTIMAGVNQTIMMALGMVVIAAMIGVQGLGQSVLQAIANQYFTLGIFSGFAIVGIAIVFDRVSQNYGRRLQRHRGRAHD